MLEKGTVKFFNNNEDKRFGFIIPESGTDADAVFFHYNGFRKFEVKGNEVAFSNRGYGHPVAFPRPGERVWFERRPNNHNKKGPAAEPWGYNHDYQRVKKEITDRPNYGDMFIYMSLCEGNLPEVTLEQYGTLTGIPMEERDKYLDMLMHRDLDYNGPYRFTRVVPYPGMQKKLGRAFRNLSYEEGPYGHCHRSIIVVEIPKEHIYTGVVEREFLKVSRSLTFAETQKLVTMGKPVFSYSEYWGSWRRILGYYTDFYTHEISVALTSSHGWDSVKTICIYDGHISGSAKNEGPFPILPDTVREDMEEAIGADLAKELLTENYLRLFTIQELKDTKKKNLRGGGLMLHEITGVQPLA